MSELLHLLGDWHHWAFELVSGAVIGATLSPLWRWAVRRHDRKAHPEAPVTQAFVQEMFRIQSALVDMKLARMADKLPTECSWCGRTSCDH